MVLSLECTREVALGRYLARRDTSRPDGSEAVFAKRFDEFEKENGEVLGFYENRGSEVILPA